MRRPVRANDPDLVPERKPVPQPSGKAPWLGAEPYLGREDGQSYKIARRDKPRQRHHKLVARKFPRKEKA